MATSTPGYWTLTATGVPSNSLALCTCPMEAAATGSAENSKNARSGGWPSSARMTSATRCGAIGGALCCRPRRACWYTSGRASPRIESIWPSFMMAPFMPPRSSKTCSAVWTWNSSSSSSPARRLRSRASATARRVARNATRRLRRARSTRTRGPDRRTSRPSTIPPAVATAPAAAALAPRAIFARRDGRQLMASAPAPPPQPPADDEGHQGADQGRQQPLDDRRTGRAEQVDGLRGLGRHGPGPGGRGRRRRLPVAATGAARQGGVRGTPRLPCLRRRRRRTDSGRHTLAARPDLGRRLLGRRLLGRLRRGRGSGRCAEHVLLQAGHELAEELGADVGHDAPAELRRPPGDRQVGDHLHLGTAALGDERGRDGGVGVPLAPGVAALGPQDGLVGGVVLLDEGRLSFVLGGDGADLHLDDAAVLVAVDLLKLGTGHAGGDPLDVRQQPPGLVDRDGHHEFVAQLHAATLSGWPDPYRLWMGPSVSRSEGNARPVRLAMISAQMDTAVSSGVRPPRSSPMGDMRRTNPSSSRPASLRRSRRLSWVRREPMTPM